jgi:hypothetical protein
MKVDPADSVLNIVARKLQSEGEYTAFGKRIAQELASLGDVAPPPFSFCH